MDDFRPSRMKRALFAGVVALSAIAIAVPADAKKKRGDRNPPGANGTVKIDGVPFDSAPDNQPHVGCIFQVDFYGFDMGDYNADVVFSIQPPSGKFREIPFEDPSSGIFGAYGNPHPFIGEDPAGGGTDVDAQETYDLNMAVYRAEQHPNQGWHIKLAVTAPQANGKMATKYKVFWVRDCIDP
jgi:hypothetical protein